MGIQGGQFEDEREIKGRGGQRRNKDFKRRGRRVKNAEDEDKLLRKQTRPEGTCHTLILIHP